VLGGTARPGRWAVQVDRLRALADALGLGPDEGGIAHLLNALLDQGVVLEGLGRQDRPRSWVEFTREVGSVAREFRQPVPRPAPGTIRMATVEEAEGSTFPHVVLIDLAEGMFPAREAVAPDARG